LFWLSCLAALAVPAGAVPLDGQTAVPLGTIRPCDTGKATLRVELVGDDDQLAHYTVGLFDYSQMTADPLDPDFALQALQADRAILLHQMGDPVNHLFEAAFPSDAQLGFFVLHEATLEDFSLGRNPFRPSFSLVSSPGSTQFIQDDALIKATTVFDYQTLEPGRVRGAGAGGFPAPSVFSINVTGHMMPREDPVVPEPATMGLVALGTALAGLAGRRRRGRAEGCGSNP
jgi:hypothetical protein